MTDILPLILGGGGLLTGIAAFITVFFNNKNSKETIKVDHSSVVFEGYNELTVALQEQMKAVYGKYDILSGKYDVLSLTVERQNEEIQSLRIELRDRDDQIRMLTLDRDDLVAIVTGPRPNMRTL